MACDKSDEATQLLEIIFVHQGHLALLYGQSVFTLKFAAWVSAHKAGTRHSGGARPADVTATDLMAMPATALP